MDSRGDHRDLHDAIDEAHDAYHDNQRGAGGYGYGYAPGYGNAPGYGSVPSYGYGSNNYYGNNGMSFGFGFGR